MVSNKSAGANGWGLRPIRSCSSAGSNTRSPSSWLAKALRRQARDLIETIPAIELPTAIAFLEFLKQRSTDALDRDDKDDKDLKDDKDDERDERDERLVSIDKAAESTAS